MDTNTPNNSTSGQPTPPPAGGPTPGSKPDANAMAILAYLSILVLIPLLTDAKNDPFVKFHIKQGIVLLVCEVVAWFLLMVPVLGWILWPIVNIAILILVIMGILNVVNKQMKELPLIGHFASNFHI